MAKRQNWNKENCLEEAKLYSDIKITEKIVDSIEKIKK